MSLAFAVYLLVADVVNTLVFDCKHVEIENDP